MVLGGDSLIAREIKKQTETETAKLNYKSQPILGMLKLLGVAAFSHFFFNKTFSANIFSVKLDYQSIALYIVIDNENNFLFWNNHIIFFLIHFAVFS